MEENKQSAEPEQAEPASKSMPEIKPASKSAPHIEVVPAEQISEGASEATSENAPENAPEATSESAPVPENAPENVPAQKPNKLVEFLANVLRGAAIGVAFIIPGFSGGSVAAILGIYEKLVGSIADIFKKFKQSILFLLPILLGMVLGIAALIFPIQWGLAHYPIPTVTLFVGLSIGGLPSITEKVKGKPQWHNAVAFLIPCAVAACMLFLPTGHNVDLFHLPASGYFLLILIGAVGACALVVPGISGSMLLLIFGYYTPLVELVTKNLIRGQNVGISIAVLACAGVGVLVGFFAISVLMKFLLKKFPRGTYFAILGFILGSVVAVYFTTVKNTDAALAYLYASPWYWVVTVLLLFVGIALSYALVWYARKKQNKK